MRKIITQNNTSQRCLNLDSDSSSSSQSNQVFQKNEIPNIQFNVKGLNGLENKLKNIKITNYQSDFLTEIQKVLSLYDDEELKYSENVVYFVMCEVEKFILKSKSGEHKKKLVCEECKRYFNNDSDLVELVINLVFHKLPQIKFFKRQGYKILKFFLKIRQNRQSNKP